VPDCRARHFAGVQGSQLWASSYGVEVTLVALKDIQLPDSMKRAMARQAEAEREKRAKIMGAARSGQ
jgi:regulator of protease activity HflC (stomatin/prohibitin superfamily)